MKRRGLLCLAALSSFFLPGCIGSGEPDAPDINAARDRWKANEPALYAYTVKHICFCPGGPVRVLAGRESVLAAEMDEHDSKGAVIDVTSLQDYSIEALLDEVDRELRHDHDERHVSFDPAYGFPAKIRIDFERQAMDEEYGLLISDFRPVNALPQPAADGIATVKVKPYLGLCGFFQPGSFGCPVISVNGGPFANSVSGITGLEFEWGKEKTLEVRIKNAPPEWMDVPPFEYTLIRETASVPVDSIRFDILVGPRDGIQWETGPAGGGTLKIMGYKEIAYTGAFPLDMNGDKPANTKLLTLELKSGALHLVSTLGIPAPAAPASPAPAIP